MQEGKRVGRYEIRSKLGVGGMGEVYLAHDSALGRDVALKVLPAELSENSDRRTRFRQEARAASALNHPNILTIYEIGESEEGWFIATELVTGETLRQLIRREKQLPVLQAVKIAEQIAGALSAAHEARIVHRDIKPENIMIRRDGYIKILDFGLAKPTHIESAPEDATLQIVKTTPGMVMGSVRYMSPEQARGKETDERTDLWSLGVCLFEMLTGKPPFNGETTSDTLAALIYEDAPPILEFVPNAPPELQRILRKALRKDRDERYQTAKDFALDLKNLRDEIEHVSSGEKHLSLSPQAHMTANGETTSLGIHRTNSAKHSTFATGNQSANLSVETSPNTLTGRIKNRRWQTVFASLGAVLVFAALGFGFYKYFGEKTHLAATAFDKKQVSRISTDGKLRLPALSPDGKYVAYLSGEVGSRTLVVRQVATDSVVTIGQPTPQEFNAMTFTPDGNYIYYVQHSKDYSIGTLYQVPTLGGTPKKLIEDIDSGVTFAPDGKRLAFIRHLPQESTDAIFIANADGTDLQQLVHSKQTGFTFFKIPAWSPDGSKIMITAGKSQGVESTGVQLVEILIASGSVKLFNPKKWKDIYDYAWFSDGSGLILSAQETEEGSMQIWRMDYPSGEVHAVTNDLNNYYKIGLSADGSTLISIKNDEVASVWSFNAANKELVQIVPESRNADGKSGLAQLPDGNLIYARHDEKELNLWKIGADGKNPQQLTAASKVNIHPVASPDGRYIVFTSNRSGASRIWRMDADGKNPKQLTADNPNAAEYDPQIMPDGKSIIFQQYNNGDEKPAFLKISIEGGEATTILSDNKVANFYPRLSPDGKLLAFISFDVVTFKKSLRVAAFGGEKVGQVVRDFDYNLMNNYMWSPDSKSLTYLSVESIPNLWKLPIDGSKPQPLTNFTSGRIFNFAWSADGKRLFISRGIVNNDLILIRDTKKK